MAPQEAGEQSRFAPAHAAARPASELREYITVEWLQQHSGHRVAVDDISELTAKYRLYGELFERHQDTVGKDEKEKLLDKAAADASSRFGSTPVFIVMPAGLAQMCEDGTVYEVNTRRKMGVTLASLLQKFGAGRAPVSPRGPARRGHCTRPARAGRSLPPGLRGARNRGGRFQCLFIFSEHNLGTPLRRFSAWSMYVHQQSAGQSSLICRQPRARRRPLCCTSTKNGGAAHGAGLGLLTASGGGSICDQHRAYCSGRRAQQPSLSPAHPSRLHALSSLPVSLALSVACSVVAGGTAYALSQLLFLRTDPVM